ncbi:gag/polymerase/env polyprotein [Penicillium waksmanii]|uniref:gag/polymerase/env polyprotein n=1 Tax=Penicillium waksmanii TaxID=69791 RepID=UPI00254775EB|nr:gag/polymerase/env polyprotein [Penicillium waksmanii]KAJ5983387.1 gag/polymerase/env polyprotein [Penicillium waksmanii]
MERRKNRGQIQDLPPPVVVDEENEWEFDRIIAVRLRYRKSQYRVRWLGQGDEDDDAWDPARNFKNAPEKIMEFHRCHPDQPGPQKRLALWAEAALNDQFEPDHPDGDRPDAVYRPGGPGPLEEEGNVTV